MQVPSSTSCVEENFALQSRVITCVETEASNYNLKKEFFCEGCAENRPSQTHHDCMNIRYLVKFERIGRHCLVCVNFENIVNNFKQQTSVITFVRLFLLI